MSLHPYDIEYMRSNAEKDRKQITEMIEKAPDHLKAKAHEIAKPVFNSQPVHGFSQTAGYVRYNLFKLFQEDARQQSYNQPVTPKPSPQSITWPILKQNSGGYPYGYPEGYTTTYTPEELERNAKTKVVIEKKENISKIYIQRLQMLADRDSERMRMGLRPTSVEEYTKDMEELDAWHNEQLKPINEEFDILTKPPPNENSCCIS